MRLSDATILFVDDEPELREIIAAWLRRSGCAVFTAANGAEALEVLMDVPVHVLVTDIRMPVMDGMALLRHIHQMGLSIPSILFVSGFADIDPREMHALGAERLIEKPLRRQPFLEDIERSLKDREELWSIPNGKAIHQRVSLEFDSLDEPEDGCGFNLGRGGCCFHSDRVLEYDKTVDLTLRFAREQLTMQVEGNVEWFRHECFCAGVSFSYLDPECRDWVIGRIKESTLRSFIPQCASEIRERQRQMPSMALSGLVGAERTT